MKNIEKFPRTNDALEAWRQSVEGGVYLSFDEWAQREYEAPRVPTLLEAVEAVVDEWWITNPNVSHRKIADLENAIAHEKAKPVRNCDRFATQEEAAAEFMKLCESGRELFEDIVKWLYEEADKEKTK